MVDVYLMMGHMTHVSLIKKVRRMKKWELR